MSKKYDSVNSVPLNILSINGTVTELVLLGIVPQPRFLVQEGKSVGCHVVIVSDTGVRVYSICSRVYATRFHRLFICFSVRILYQLFANFYRLLNVLLNLLLHFPLLFHLQLVKLTKYLQ